MLTTLGRNMLAAFMSPWLLQLCHTAIIEKERFPRAKRVYHELGLRPAIATLARMFEMSDARGETTIPDCRAAASQFIAMLRGNIHFEAVLELRPPPSAPEIEARVAATVRTFLHGVRARAAGTERLDMSHAG